MPIGVDQPHLLLGKAPPEQEDQALMPVGQGADGGIGEAFPAPALVGAGHGGPYRERGVEEQYALPGPSGKVAVCGMRNAQVAMQFLEQVHQGRRRGHSDGHRETETMRLAGAVVGVLAKDHHPHLIERCGIEGGEDPLARREYRGLLAFGHEEGP